MKNPRTSPSTLISKRGEVIESADLMDTSPVVGCLHTMDTPLKVTSRREGCLPHHWVILRFRETPTEAAPLPQIKVKIRTVDDELMTLKYLNPVFNVKCHVINDKWCNSSSVLVEPIIDNL